MSESLTGGDGGFPPTDPRCKHWPRALRKAVIDPFDYALGWRGHVVKFESANPCDGENGDWVSLGSPVLVPPVMIDGGEASFDRGLEVRVADIIWVSDAGGSDS